MIDNGPQPLAPSSGVTRAGVNMGNGPVLPSISLFKGQVIEGVVIQLQPRLLVETSSSIFSAAATSAAYTLGERLLFRVLDPEVKPPRLELLRSGQLPDSPLAQQSAFLRSLLYRPNSLAPLQQWLTSQHTASHLPTALAALLQEFWQMPSAPKAVDIQRAMLMSGLFSENRAKANSLSANLMGPAKTHNDLKALLKLVALEDGFEQQVKPLLEALHSSQIKSLDAALNGQVHYQWLMPWLDQQHFTINLQQSQAQRSQRQWFISLAHEGPDLGVLQINLLLTQSQHSQPAMANLHFASDSNWLGPLINSSKHQLHAALEQQDIVLQQVSVGPYTDTKNNGLTDALGSENMSHTILDVHV